MVDRNKNKLANFAKKNNTQIKKIFLFFILNISLMANVFAYNFAVKNSDGIMIYYNRSGTNAAVTYKNTSYNSYSGDIRIPDEVVYNGTTYTVASIGNYAFHNCHGLTSITIPNSVTMIGDHAFGGCSRLKEIICKNPIPPNLAYSSVFS